MSPRAHPCRTEAIDTGRVLCLRTAPDEVWRGMSVSSSINAISCLDPVSFNRGVDRQQRQPVPFVQATSRRLHTYESRSWQAVEARDGGLWSSVTMGPARGASSACWSECRTGRPQAGSSVAPGPSRESAAASPEFPAAAFSTAPAERRRKQGPCAWRAIESPRNIRSKGSGRCWSGS